MCAVQERLLVQCSLYRSTSARQHDRCRHVPTVAPQPPHNQDQPVSWPGKIFVHGEKYLVHTVRPGSSDLIITETVDCVQFARSSTLTCDQGGVLRWRGVTTVSSGDKKVPVERFSRCKP